MSRNLHPYPAYKDSGVPWLGEVPAHWNTGRLKNRVANIVEQTDSGATDDIYIALEHVESWTGRIRAPKESVSFESQVKRFRPNDVLFGKLRPYLAKVARPSVPGVCVGEFFVLRPNAADVKPEFLAYLLRAKPIIDVVNSSTYGAKMPRANWNFVGNLLLNFPPTAEQHAITRFLDHNDRRINRYIRAKRKLIALLNEQKQAIIHRAVTRGLDPNVPLKPSGVEWLGEIPAHWAALPLKKCVSTKITDGPHETPTLLDEGVPFLSAESIVDNHFDFSKRRGFISKEDHALFSKKCYPQRFDVFMCKSGATTGKVAMVETDEEFSVWSPLALIRADSTKVLPHFLFMVLQTAYVQRQVQLTWSYGTQPNLSMSAMERLLIVLPPLSEQEAILDCIDPIVTQLGEAVTKARKQIDLIREYRTRLIADVVTGKLDVRGVALPEEGETDAEELDEQGLDGEGEELDAWEEVEDGEDD